MKGCLSANGAVRLLGLMALALAVMLSGFANRLARYSDPTDRISRASVTKLWDKHHNVIQVISAKLKARPRGALDLAAALREQPVPFSEEAPFLPVSDFEVLTSFSSLLPSRSPPAHAQV